MTPQSASLKCDEIVELIDDEVPEGAKAKARTFFEDVRAKVMSVQETIERTGRVSSAQVSALEGWEAGVRRWIRD